MTRRESRETAFALLFEWSFQPEETLDVLIANAVQGRSIVVDDFAHKLAARTIDYYIQLDAIIDQYSDKWKIGRLSRVVLSVLRLSFCQLAYFDDIPAGACINEAVELVKKFATEDEAAYVNGLLGTYERDKKSGVV